MMHGVRARKEHVQVWGRKRVPLPFEIHIYTEQQEAYLTYKLHDAPCCSGSSEPIDHKVALGMIESLRMTLLEVIEK